MCRDLWGVIGPSNRTWECSLAISGSCQMCALTSRFIRSKFTRFDTLILCFMVLADLKPVADLKVTAMAGAT